MKGIKKITQIIIAFASIVFIISSFIMTSYFGEGIIVMHASASDQATYQTMYINTDVENENFEPGSVVVSLKSEYSRYRGISSNVIDKLYEIGMKSVEDLSELSPQYVNEDGTINKETAF